MIELDNLTGYKKGRLWINDLPVINYNVVELIEEKFKANTFECQGKSIALEIALPRNSSNYALLGATYIPDESGFLNVEVKISSLEDDEFKGNIASTVDKVICGIPKEYGEAILEYIRNNINDFKVPSGKLVFEIGAHGLVGSSKAIFSLLAKVIIELVVYNLKDNEIASIKDIVLKSI
ncbi:hypothetical protein [Clostridium lundense]|uniref:hypothetical protein n=1 Tax=Clostridium lundense TaxID=319475 RepID=UPI000484A95D|nr:hypothetical protein [Clostridium lundense]